MRRRALPTDLLDYKGADIRIVTNTFMERKFRVKPAFKEPETVAWIDEHVQEGDVFYDVGANIGAYGMIAASRGAKVYAFEPEAMNYGRLVQNIELNQDIAHRIFPLSMALWDAHALLTMHMREATPGAAQHKIFSNGTNIEGMPFRQTLFTVQLDDLHTWGIPIPNHIKIDVDGYEANVLNGAQLMLASPVLRTVMCEIEMTHEHKDNVFAAFHSADMREEGRWQQKQTDDTEPWNYLFVKN